MDFSPMKGERTKVTWRDVSFTVGQSQALHLEDPGAPFLLYP